MLLVGLCIRFIATYQTMTYPEKNEYLLYRIRTPVCVYKKNHINNTDKLRTHDFRLPGLRNRNLLRISYNSEM